MAGQRFLFRQVLSFHQTLNWPMHKCITLLCSVSPSLLAIGKEPISPPLYFSFCPFAGLSLSLFVKQLVFSEWNRASSFFHYSLAQLSAVWSGSKAAKASARYLARAQITFTNTNMHAARKRSHTNMHARFRCGLWTAQVGDRKLGDYSESLFLIKHCWIASDR